MSFSVRKDCIRDFVLAVTAELGPASRALLLVMHAREPRASVSNMLRGASAHQRLKSHLEGASLSPKDGLV
jgi:hypothetical protein